MTNIDLRQEVQRDNNNIISDKYKNNDNIIKKEIITSEKLPDYGKLASDIALINEKINEIKESRGVGNLKLSILSDNISKNFFYNDEELKILHNRYITTNDITSKRKGGYSINFENIERIRQINRDKINLKFRKNLKEGFSVLDFIKPITKLVNLDLHLYFKRMDETITRDKITFILKDIKNNENYDSYVGQIDIENNGILFNSIGNIFKNNEARGIDSFIILSKIINIENNIIDKDNLFRDNDNIYVTTDISTDELNRAIVNGKSYTALGRFSFEEFKDFKIDNKDIDLFKKDGFLKEYYRIKISSIEQLKRFYIFLSKIEDIETPISFENRPEKLSFEFIFT